MTFIGSMGFHHNNSSCDNGNSTVYTKLDLSNSTTSLPYHLYQTQSGLFNRIQNSANVQQLLLRRNRLDSLEKYTEALDSMKASLTELSLRDNRFTQFPAEITVLKNLTSLSLANNDLGSIPEGIFPELSHLRWLNLRGNGLKMLPYDIVCCHVLTGMNLEQNGFKNGIVEEISVLGNIYLTSLTHLEFPEVLFFLTSLEILMISRNRISSISSKYIFPRSIRTLSLGFNQLTVVPHTLVYDPPPLLSHLQLSGNPLCSLPHDFLTTGYSHIVSLDFHTCQLTTISGSFFVRLAYRCPLLRRLNLAINKLTSLPPEIGLCSQLNWLNLNDNQISDLPESMTNMVHLIKLGLVQNKLTTLPSNLLMNMKQLLKLDIRHNQLEFFPSSIMALLPDSEVRQHALVAASCEVFNIYENNLEFIGSNNEKTTFRRVEPCHVCRCYHRNYFDKNGDTLGKDTDIATATSSSSSTETTTNLPYYHQLCLHYTTNDSNCCHRRYGGSLRTLMVSHNAQTLQHADGILCNTSLKIDQGDSKDADTHTMQILSLKEAFQILQHTAYLPSQSSNANTSLKARKKKVLHEACFFKEKRNHTVYSAGSSSNIDVTDITTSSENSNRDRTFKKPRTYRSCRDARFTVVGRHRMLNALMDIDTDDEEDEETIEKNIDVQKFAEEKSIVETTRNKLSEVFPLYELSLRQQLNNMTFTPSRYHFTNLQNSTHQPYQTNSDRENCSSSAPSNSHLTKQQLQKKRQRLSSHQTDRLLKAAFPRGILPPLLLSDILRRSPRQCSFCLRWNSYSPYSIAVNTKICNNRLQIPIRHNVCSFDCALEAIILLYERTMNYHCLDPTLFLGLQVARSITSSQGTRFSTEHQQQQQQQQLSPRLLSSAGRNNNATDEWNERSITFPLATPLYDYQNAARQIWQYASPDWRILNQQQYELENQRSFLFRETRIEYAESHAHQNTRINSPPLSSGTATSSSQHSFARPLAAARRLTRLVRNRVQAMHLFQNHTDNSSALATEERVEPSSSSSSNSPDSIVVQNQPDHRLVNPNAGEIREEEQLTEQQPQARHRYQIISSTNINDHELHPTIPLTQTERILSPQPHLTAFNHLPRDAIRLERF
ncbi:hypothetical protein BDF20DRAFT_943468 [Mycotypha africana]|uniref:uncharacterized protein n=1 Tax=Mycotypha africana TaxID=64632 RepID=UPI002301808F|nr:uncharacterized protein BDF20DRAFT_943468 [Mycotypha africana]KAI8975197.1 hypothetical protein BDF20DRAFT_943468 [Mycotypha africana]